MTLATPLGTPKQYVRFAAALIVSFALTIGCFAASTVVTELRARGIEAAADSIASNAIPSIHHLGAARSELRRVDALLDDLVRRVADRHDVDGTHELQKSREALERQWTLYQTLPSYADESKLQAAVDADIVSMNASIDDVVRHFREGEARAALDELSSRTWLAIDRVDEGLREAEEINQHNAAMLSSRIASLRISARTWAYALDGVSAFFAIMAAILVLRLVSRFARVTEIRVSELERFAGRVAHDIRSPLTSVGLILERAQQSPQLDAKTRAMLGRGTGTIQRVSELVDGLLVLARAGTRAPSDASTDVEPVIRAILDELRPIAEEKGIELRIEEPIPSMVAACSPGVFSSLIANLVGNAIKYMGDAPVRQIDVTVRDLGAALRVEVRDTGPGVAPALRERIFDPYVRATLSAVPGLGLGLATVRRLVETHGGRVTVEPNAAGGSCFSFELPKFAAGSQ